VKRVAIIQARMTSSRLPGKVLVDLEGRPMLAQQLARLRRCRNLDEICIATTTNHTDDPIVELCRKEDVAWFRGDENDVLLRYAGAAAERQAELVIRITSDCPLVDPEVTDRVIGAAFEPDDRCDYVTNRERNYPRGLDTEVFFTDTLMRMERLATSKPAREHVTWFCYRERADLFILREFNQSADNSDLRWTVDTPEDLALVRAIYAQSGIAERPLAYEELVAFVRARPELSAINAHVQQKSQ
jgi:spore coat polysaccharide biosynthesis protein SpsF